MIYGYENGITLFLMVVSLIIVLVAQSKVKGTYNKYKKILNNSN